VVAIIDTHQHLGSCRTFDRDVSADELLVALDAHGVTGALVLPFPWPPDEKAAHDAIAALVAKVPRRIRGIASINPHVEEKDYLAEAERCVRQLGFVALKLHPLGHACSPLGRDATKVFEAARGLKVPVLVHTGQGAPWAMPSLLIPRAHQYPDVTIVLCHAGAGYFSQEAVAAAQVCDNIFLETSWCTLPRIKEMLRTVGSQRIMFGADVPENVPVEITKYRHLRLSDTEVDDCLNGTARRVFGLGDVDFARDEFSEEQILD